MNKNIQKIMQSMDKPIENLFKKIEKHPKLSDFVYSKLDWFNTKASREKYSMALGASAFIIGLIYLPSIFPKYGFEVQLNEQKEVITALKGFIDKSEKMAASVPETVDLEPQFMELKKELVKLETENKADLEKYMKENNGNRVSNKDGALANLSKFIFTNNIKNYEFKLGVVQKIQVEKNGDNLKLKLAQKNQGAGLYAHNYTLTVLCNTYPVDECSPIINSFKTTKLQEFSYIKQITLSTEKWPTSKIELQMFSLDKDEVWSKLNTKEGR